MMLFENITQPVLAIDCGPTTSRALVYVPGLAIPDVPKIVLPSAELRAVHRLRSAMNEGRDVFINAFIPCNSLADALFTHVANGYGVAIHPEVAASFLMDNSILASRGIDVRYSCPTGYREISASDITPSKWRELCKLIAVPDPAVILAAANEMASMSDAISTDSCAPIIFNCAATDGKGIPIASLLYKSVPPQFRRLEAIHSATNAPVAESFSAVIMGFLAQPTVYARQLRQGILVVRVGGAFLRAALIYKNSVYGYVEIPVEGTDLQNMLADLESFRLGWLPSESVSMRGGFVSLPHALPAEAEGFKPMYLTGPNALWLSGYGSTIQVYGDSLLTGCWGMLYAYNMLLEKGRNDV